MAAAPVTTTPDVSAPPLPPPSARSSAAPSTDQTSGRVLRSLVQPETTPGWLRLWGLVLVVALAVFAITGTIAAQAARSSANTIEQNTAPSLIGVQDLFSSVAEANAAATGAFLSGATGVENRSQRNLYLDAIRRSTGQAEDVSALVGDSAVAHDALKEIGADLATYSGEIESSRTANLASLPGAQDQLSGALDIAGTEIAASVATVTAEARAQLDAQTDNGIVWQLVAVVAGIVALLLLVLFQLRLTSRTNRILNLPLAAATLLTVFALGALVSGLTTRSSALANAESGGYDSIESTAQIQAAAFEAQTELSLALIDGQSTVVTLAEVDQGIADAQAAADAPREQAAVDLLAQRFERYRAAVTEINQLAANGQTEAAIATFQGDGLSTFNGVNTSIESVLSDNRTQFTDGVSSAADAVGNLPIYLVVLPVLAALAAVFGISNRLGEYR